MPTFVERSEPGRQPAHRIGAGRITKLGHRWLPGSAAEARAGSKPAATSDDLPLPDGPMIPKEPVDCEPSDQLSDQPVSSAEVSRAPPPRTTPALKRAQDRMPIRRAIPGTRRRSRRHVLAGQHPEKRPRLEPRSGHGGPPRLGRAHHLRAW